jgi:glutamyl-tRNA synthetase
LERNLNLDHAKVAIINAEYAKMYGGKLILRMDDTNPESERIGYHMVIKKLNKNLVIMNKLKNNND